MWKQLAQNAVYQCFLTLWFATVRYGGDTSLISIGDELAGYTFGEVHHGNCILYCTGL